MKTSRAGRAEANIIQMGKWEYKPSGWMIQPRAEELDTVRPSGTLSFWGRRMLVRIPGQGDGDGGGGRGSQGPGHVGTYLYSVSTLYLVTALSPLHICSYSQLYR